MKILFSFLFSLFVMRFVAAQPEITWQMCYGGSDEDFFTDAAKTIDGGIVTTILTRSTDGDVPEGHIVDGWIIKFDSAFNIVWQKFIGDDTCNMDLYKVKEFANGDLLFGGSQSGNCFGEIFGSSDINVFKTDKEGNIIWGNTYGSPGNEEFVNITITEDAGCLITLNSYSSGGTIPIHHGDIFSSDAVVIKIDSAGNTQWVKVLGGSGTDWNKGDIIETKRGFYQQHIGAYSDNFDLAGSGIDGGKHWVVELDSLGNINNEKFYSIDSDVLYWNSAMNLENNELLLVGSGDANSTIYTTAPEHTGFEGMVAKYDSLLNIIEMKQWGGTGEDVFERYIQDEFQNLYFLGYSTSKDYDLPGNYNNGEAIDYWILKTDKNLNLLWSKNFGGSYDLGDYRIGNIIITQNVVYCFVACSVPEILPDFDINCGHLSPAPDLVLTSDAWIVAFDISNEINNIDMLDRVYSVYPNPSDGNFIIKNNRPTIESIQLTIVDIMGKIMQQITTTNEAVINIDTVNMPAGFYYLNILKNNVLVFSSKIIIN